MSLTDWEAGSVKGWADLVIIFGRECITGAHVVRNRVGQHGAIHGYRTAGRRGELYVGRFPRELKGLSTPEDASLAVMWEHECPGVNNYKRIIDDEHHTVQITLCGLQVHYQCPNCRNGASFVVDDEEASLALIQILYGREQEGIL